MSGESIAVKRQRSNLAERKRMKRIGEAFDKLQSCLPCFQSHQRKTQTRHLSRVMILRQASEYIQTLDKILNFPYLLPSNGLEPCPEYTWSAASPQVQSQTETDSCHPIENGNQLSTSEILRIFQVELMEKEDPSLNSICPASLALKQMAEANNELMNSHPATQYMNQLPAQLNKEGHNSPPLPCCRLTPTPSWDVVEASNEQVDSDQSQTVVWMSTRPKTKGCTCPPYPSCRPTPPLKHLAEANGESVKSDKAQFMECSPPLQIKKGDCFSLPLPCCACTLTFPQQHLGNSGQREKQEVNNSCQFVPAPDLNQTVPWSAHAQEIQPNAKALEFHLVTETTCLAPWDEFL